MSKTISFQTLSEWTSSRWGSPPRALKEGCWQETIGGSVLLITCRLFIEAQKYRRWQLAEEQNKQI